MLHCWIDSGFAQSGTYFGHAALGAGLDQMCPAESPSPLLWSLRLLWFSALGRLDYGGLSNGLPQSLGYRQRLKASSQHAYSPVGAW